MMYHTHVIMTSNLNIYLLLQFFTAFYIVKQLVLQTIHVPNKKILQFLGLKSRAYNLQWFQIKSGL